MTNISRQLLYQEDPKVDGLKKVTETLNNLGIDPGNFIRTFSIRHMVKDMETGELRHEIPGLKSVFPSIKETLPVTTALAQVKIADTVLEGADPYGFWKNVWRIESMDVPKLSLPKASAADLVPALADLKYSDGAVKKEAGGKIESVDFDCADDKGYYAVAAQVKRNWVKDNNFRALETHLKLLGEAWYYRIGEFLFSQHAGSITTNTDTRANLDGASGTILEALINVIENKIPGKRFRPDTAIFHPADMYAMKVEQWGTGGPIPLMSNQYFDRNASNVNNTGVAAILGLKNVWVTPWATENTVLVFDSMKSFIVGLRQDLEFEDWNDTLKGLVGTSVSVRFDQQKGFEDGGYKITSV